MTLNGEMMEIEPWMLLLYMGCGICFFIFLSIKVTPIFARRAILNGLKGPEGKIIMREIVLSAISAMDEEIEIPGPPDEAGKPTVVKTTIGNMVMGAVAAAVVKHIRMAFLGEKGHMSREGKSMQADLMLAGLPEALQPFAAMMGPMLKKYPLAGGILAMAQAYMANKSQGIPGIAAGGGVPKY